MKINYKKNLKIITLFLSSLLIATVSASVYYSLTMTSTISVATTNIYFVKGPDNSTAGVVLSSDNKSAQLTTLKAYPNVTTTYDDPIRVKNNATSGSTNIRLRHVSLTGSAAQFIFINFTLMDGTTEKANLDYTSNGATWTTPSTTDWSAIPFGEAWTIKIETKAKAGATTDSVTIVIAVDVQ
jgi:hypothetical protein